MELELISELSPAIAALVPGSLPSPLGQASLQWKVCYVESVQGWQRPDMSGVKRAWLKDEERPCFPEMILTRLGSL